ncbi:MAG: T9SS type A sorting domain-containing protein, partial [Bacteroidetes bacterium]|nr:T9SS type A sorting domain-containing protein [Bacteroidota bacterium]
VFITPTIYTLNNEIANSIQNLQLFPNPTNQQSTLMFYLKSAEQITFSVQDVFGKSIMKTVNENFSKGNQKININTSELKSGIYICKIQSESGEQIIKLIITR